VARKAVCYILGA